MIFFFQAEDGIRDLYVTGVQTRALPISPAGPDFDSRFLTLLTGHQHGAVELARMEQKDGFNKDARELADRVVRSRRSEERRVGKECRSRLAVEQLRERIAAHEIAIGVVE